MCLGMAQGCLDILSSDDAKEGFSARALAHAATFEVTHILPQYTRLYQQALHA